MKHAAHTRPIVAKNSCRLPEASIHSPSQPNRVTTAVARALGKSVCSLAFLALAGSAAAQTYTYNPITATDNWSTGTNWTAVPVSSVDTLLVFSPTGGTFPGAVTNTNTNNIGAFLLNQLTLGGIGPVAAGSPVVVNIGGGTLDFNFDSLAAAPVINLTATNGGSTVTYNVGSAIALTGDVSLTGTGNATFNFTGAVSGAGALTKSGTSTVTLSGANTSSGLTTVSNGTLALGASNALGSGGLTVNGAAAILAMGSNSDSVGQVILDGGGSITGSGTLTSTVGFEVHNGTANVVLAGNVNLTKDFAGTVTLNGVNTYTGATTINSGILKIGAASGIGAGTVGNTLTLNGGTLNSTASMDLGVNRTVTVNGNAILQSDVSTLTVSGTVTINGGSTLTVQGVGNTDLTSAINDGGTGGNITKTGAGTLTLGSANNYNGLTSITGGTLALGASNGIGSGDVTLTNAAILSLGANSDTVGTVTLTSGSITGTGTLTSTAGFIVSSGTVSANLAGGVGLTKNAAGTVTLSGANTYLGVTAINGGILKISAPGNLGTGTSITFAGGTLNNTATVDLGTSRAITLSGAGTLSSDATMTLTVGGTVDLAGNTLSVPGAGTVVITGAISGVGGSISKSTNGSTLTLSGNNTYTGGTTVAGNSTSVLNINSATALGTGAVTFNNESTFNNTSGAPIVLTNNNNVNFTNGNTLAFTGTNNLSFGTGTFTVVGANRVIKPNAGILTFGSLNTSATGIQIRKEGNGTLAVTGAAGANFTGVFFMDGGVLLLGNKDAIGTGQLTLQNGSIQGSIDLSGANKLPNASSLNQVTLIGTNNIEFGDKLTGMSNSDRTVTNSLSAGAVLTYNNIDINADTTTIRALTFAGTGTTVVNGVIASGTSVAHRIIINSNTAPVGTGVTFNGANTYTGSTTVSGFGILQIGSDSTPTSGVVTSGPIGTGTLIPNSANAQIRAVGGARTIGNAISFANTTSNFTGSNALTINGAATWGGSNTINVTNPTTTFGGTFTLRSDAQSSVRSLTYTGAGNLVFNGPVVPGTTSNGQMNFNGSGTVSLNGNNTYNGDTTIGTGATAKLGHANGLGFGGPVVSTAAKTVVNSGGTLDLGGQGPINEPITLNGAGVGSNGALINSSGTQAVIGTGLAVVLLGSGGGGYSTAPAVTVTGGGAVTSATMATTLGLSTASVTTNLNGTVYSNAPTVTISGGGGVGAAATVTTGGVISITNPGFGYTSAPTFVFTGGTITNGGPGMSATGNATNFVVSGLLLTSAGSGYTSSPTISIDPGSSGTATAGSVTRTSVNMATASTFGGAGDTLIESALSGGFALTKTGAGKLTIAGSNASSTTQINNGILQIGNGGTTGAIGAGTVTNNASLIFNRSDTLSVNSDINGTGSVTNNGGAANILILNGLQNYATLNANSGSTNLNGSFTSGTSTVNVNGTAEVYSATSQTLAALNLGAGPLAEDGLGAASSFGGPATAAVPEPGSIGLLVVGALGLLARRRRTER